MAGSGDRGAGGRGGLGHPPSPLSANANAGAGAGAAGDDYSLRWSFGQCFGEKSPDEDFQEADVLTAVSFSPDGEHLATGDKGGRIVVFSREGGKEEEQGEATKDGSGCTYRFYAEFQSHETTFDFLKSIEIEEKINQIAWCRSANDAQYLLSTNDKTVKLWKIQEKQVKQVSNFNVQRGRYGTGALATRRLRLPKVRPTETQVVATARRVYAHAHAYHINSISANSDGQTFLSADDLRINLWNMEDSKLSFNIVDIKPENMEDLTEVITSAKFHPQHCHTFLYSTSRGSIKLGDMRASALCDRHAKFFVEPDADAGAKTYFSEIIASVSDVQFTPDDHYLVSRDYLTVKVWDVRNEGRGPVRTIAVHEQLRPRLCELYETDCIFDKFELGMSADGRHLLTGTYSDSFRVLDLQKNIESSMMLSRSRPVPPAHRPLQRGGDAVERGVGAVQGYGTEEAPDFARKVLHYAWHPERDAIAVAGVNNLFIFTANRGGAASVSAVGTGGSAAAGGGSRRSGRR